ncbi:MAG: hypothetical protein K2Q34_04065 [Alphaproteobacteria bacterium]|nr:hypothetical protein [Alphaproteobacteria bacterium]
MIKDDLPWAKILRSPILWNTIFTVRESFKKKADTYEEQLELRETVKRAEQRMRAETSIEEFIL